MPTVFRKLNLKDQAEILVLHVPESFEPELASLSNVTVHRDASQLKKIAFALAFVIKQTEVDALAKTLTKKAEGDAVLWFAYPKGTSKKYSCEFNRDTGWARLGQNGFEPVRQVAIDEDWSALRFRRVDFIKSMTRVSSMALSKAGKARTPKK